LIEFVDNLKDGYTYAIIPILITLPDSKLDGRIITLDTQRIITNKTNINSLDAWITKVQDDNYLIYGNIINEGIFIIRYRVISFSKLIFDKISNKELLLNSNVIFKSQDNLGSYM